MTPDPIKKNNVSVIGNPNASRTMVFVHGFGTDQSVWREVVADFLDDFRIVLLDNVGAGQASPEAFVQHHYLKLDRYAEDLLDICHALQLQDAILVGHSVGGMISVLAAIREPRLFARLVLIGASPRYLNDGDYTGGFTTDDLNGLYSALTENYEEWADGFAPLVMANPQYPQLARNFAAAIKSIPSRNAMTVLCSIFQSDHRADVEQLAKPTLLIQSQEDIAVPLSVAQYLNQHISGSLLQVIDATGHLPHVSAPGAVVQAIRGFVA